ncbi:MAG: hypothetical protein GY816_16745 [Cytophagales bacterium]|nr:hypothetical protein [Cytophagales bacterium]
MKSILIALTLLICFSAISQKFELVVPIGHTKSVSDIAISKDQKWLASIDGTNRIIFWDFENRKELYHLKSHSSGVRSILFSNEKLVSGSTDKTLKIWSLKDQILKSIDLDGAVEKIVRTKEEGVVVALVNPNLAYKVDLNSGSVLASMKLGIDGVKSGEFISESNEIVVGSNYGEVEVISVDEMKSTRGQVKLTDKRIGVIRSYEDKLAIATDNGRVMILDKELEVLLESQPFGTRTYDLLVSPATNKLIACGRGGEANIKILSLSNLEVLETPMENLTGPETDIFRRGLRKMTWSKKDSTVLVADYFHNLRFLDIHTLNSDSEMFKGHAQPIFDIDLDTKGENLAIASGHASIDIVDLTGGSQNIQIPTEKSIRTIDFHPVNSMVATYSLDDRINVWNVSTGTSISDFKAKSRFSSTRATFDPTGNYLIRRNSDKDFDLYNFKRSRPKNLKVNNGRKFHFSGDGRKLFFLSDGVILIYDPIALSLQKEISIPNIKDFGIAQDDRIAVLLKDGKTIQLYDATFKKVSEFALSDIQVDRIVWVSQDEIIGYKNTTKKGQLQPDYSLSLIDAKKGQMTRSIEGHQAFVNKIQIHQKSGMMISSSIDGKINFWNLKEKTPFKASYIQFENGEYVVSTKEGIYDASPKAMKLMHYSKAGEIIGLDQMKSFYEPNLLPKLLGYIREPMRSGSDLNELKLFPDVKINHPLHNDGKLGITLNDQGGGIGRVVIIINGKEVSSDARDIMGGADLSNAEFDYEIDGHPYLLENKVNKISVHAYNFDGTISSKSKNIYMYGEKKDSKENQPKLFAIVAGTSDYSGDQLDLKFAAKDANDFANALELASENFLGNDNIEIKLLTTENPDKKQWPTKKNIMEAFKSFSEQAKAKDILVVYLSGHGVNYGGVEGDFYYLTTLSEDGDLSSKEVRERVGISSQEFTELIRSVPALKQVMVIDACHSGRLATNLVSSRSTMSSTQIRALERMKDRTGLFVLAGSAADAVSYETTLYDQGLLTYSLLFGMKGAALRDDEFLDVMELFQFAAEKVPELAEDIGGIQKPQIRLPVGSSSFDIGRMEDHHRTQIRLKEPKPAFINSNFQDEAAIYDPLGMTNIMDEKLLEFSKISEAPIVYIDDNKFSGSLRIVGRYAYKGDLLVATIKIIRDEEVIDELEFEAVNVNLLTDQILDHIKHNY